MNFKKLELKIRAKINPAKEWSYSHIKSAYFKDSATQLLLIPTFTLLVAVWILSLYYFKVSNYMIPVRYSSFLGVMDLGRWYQVYEIPLFLTLCVVINVVLANVIYKKDKFLGYIVTASNIFIALVVITVIINFGRIIG